MAVGGGVGHRSHLVEGFESDTHRIDHVVVVGHRESQQFPFEIGRKTPEMDYLAEFVPASRGQTVRSYPCRA